MNFSLNHAPLFAALNPRAAADVERICCYYAALTQHEDSGPAVHAIMAKHAIGECFDENTGGWVWLSYTVDVIGVESRPVLIIAGCDSCSVYLLPEDCDPAQVNPESAAAAIWELCGDEDSVRLASMYVEEE